ncbi:class I SAM-dependent methyltransferase [Haloglomus litoreum]|uniref:class I SAM-dependent methyltransferase n=1 Tax=Haloglomus litoreum TaxID=3034026 RepID=UPI0023E781E4|nr:class I SAM-dependent methyltransferase [Haloglomus sp. DT116]
MDDRTYWDERYRDATFRLPEEPSRPLREFADALPEGRAFDVATGTGRNALFLAAAGYEVDAVDVSGVGLDEARERAAERDLDGHVDWIQADLDTYCVPESAYDVVSVSFYRALELLPDLKEALAPGGVLCYEHHLRSPEADRGPSDDRHRFRSNDLLRAVLDLTVLHYEETTRVEDGRTSAVATIVARNTGGGSQTYPRRPAE